MQIRGLAAAFFIVFVSVVFAANENIDKKTSSISVTFTQIGVPVNAKFTDFSGSIDYDPANAAAASAQLTVKLSSFDMGDVEYNKEVLKKEWFNATQFPQATFSSQSIKVLSPDKLQAQGKLVIKGKSLDVIVPIAFKQNGKTKVFSGTLPIKRLYFNIGEGEWKDTDTLADEVTIQFTIVTSTTN